MEPDKQPTTEPPVEPPAEEKVTEPEEQTHSTADFVKNIEPLQQQKKKRRMIRIIMLIGLLLFGLGAAGYFLFMKNGSAPSDQPAGQSQTETEQTVTQTVDTELSEHYVSQDLKLSLDYPADWQKDDSTTNLLKLESPITKLDGTEAKIFVTLQGGSASPVGFTGNSGKAVAESEKIAYTSPSQGQRKETYLSFAGFGNGTDIDAIYITGDKGYTQGQDVPKSDVVVIVPIVSVTFQQCEGTECSEPHTVSHELWQSNQMLNVAKSILQSLVIE